MRRCGKAPQKTSRLPLNTPPSPFHPSPSLLRREAALKFRPGATIKAHHANIKDPNVRCAFGLIGTSLCFGLSITSAPSHVSPRTAV